MDYKAYGVHVFACVHMHACAHMHTHAHIHTHTCTHTRIVTHTCHPSKLSKVDSLFLRLSVKDTLDRESSVSKTVRDV